MRIKSSIFFFFFLEESEKKKRTKQQNNNDKKSPMKVTIINVNRYWNFLTMYRKIRC